jgi:hypothetical protein
MRAERLPADHCPQLAELEPREEVEVVADPWPYVDVDLYRFALSEEDVTRVVDGLPRQLLRTLEDCRSLLIPPGAEMWVEFGIDVARLRGGDISARFVITVQDGDSEPRVLLDRRLTPESESPWRGRNIPLGDYTYRTVDICVAAEVDEERKNPLAVAWSNPLIMSTIQRPVLEVTQQVITEQERSLREQQLKALGYVN